MTIQDMKNVDIKTVDPKELVDITKITIKESLQGEKRKEEFLKQVKNPYCFKVGNIMVKSCYLEGATFTEKFQDMILSIF